MKPLLPSCLVFASHLAFAAPTAHVDAFSPQGSVKGVRQVVAHFSEAMVPLGDPRATKQDPFEISCPAQGASRWIDPRSWSFDFDQDLEPGIACTFTLKPGTRSLSGHPVAASQFAFDTGGPSILETQPWSSEWNKIVEDQVFILTLDGDVVPESALEHAAFQVEGLAQPVPVRLIEGKDREAILKTLYARPKHAVLIQARQAFPEDSKIELIWGAGIRSPNGGQTTQEQRKEFRTRPAFHADFSCERESAEASCLPMLNLRLHFSSEISTRQAEKITLRDAQGKIWKARIGEEREGPAPEIVDQVEFHGPFPSEAELEIQVPTGLKDVDGRPLQNAASFPLKVRTGRAAPLAKFSNWFGVLELKADPALPLTMRRLEPVVQGRVLEPLPGQSLRLAQADATTLLHWLARVRQYSNDEHRAESIFSASPSIATPIKVPRPAESAALEVVGIPFKDPGFYIVEIESGALGRALLAKPGPMYVRSAVLVTDLAVHLKQGKESSLIWVTRLSDAKPVPSAEVAVHDCRGRELWKGATDPNGLARIDRELKDAQGCSSSLEGLFVTARKDGDLSFVSASWNEGLEAWRFQLPDGRWEGERSQALAHTVLDRSLLRAGDTLHMKHLVRRHTLAGFRALATRNLPREFVIRHLGSEASWKLPLKWNSNGSAESEWKIPPDAKLGQYSITLGEGLESGNFRVEEFRVPLLKGSLAYAGLPLIQPSEVSVDLSVRYLSGGAAGLLPVRLRYQARPLESLHFDGYDDFTFANGPVAERKQRRDRPSEELEPTTDVQAPIATQDLKLDAAGTARATFVPPASPPGLPQRLETEFEYKDPNGEIQTTAAVTTIWPASRVIGLSTPGWMATRASTKARAAVLDLDGHPVRGAPARIDIFERTIYTHRKRLIGGFYAYEDTEVIRKLGTLCSGETDASGVLSCEGQAPASGNLILQATSQDEQGRTVATHQDLWILGDEGTWFSSHDNDRMDLLPEKKHYEPGETARFQVRMPFKEATALVTVEREGVAEAFVTQVSARKPVIEVPVMGHHAPNVFVSALLVRGRVSEPRPTAMVDLGRPAFRLGLSEIKVGWRAHELKVSVMPERATYRVREKARVRVRVRTSDDNAPPVGSEVALAVVDEGLLQLKNNESWDVLRAFMGQRSLEVATSMMQGFVVGKRHFGLKALPTGGGGGTVAATSRELFDTLLLWKARLPLDAKGEASLEVPLNDSVTSFRIVAVATGGFGLFGSGAGNIRSAQELMILPGLPPLVRAGDRFQAEITVRNTTAQPMPVDLKVHAEGLVLNPIHVDLAAGEARRVGWEIQIPATTQHPIEYRIDAQAPEASDSVKITQKVIELVPVRTYQATLEQLTKALNLPIEKPQDALPQRGGIDVALAPSLLSGLEGVREYMAFYPYSCLEQRLSKAVALEDRSAWKRIASELPTYLDANGLAKYFPSMPTGSDTLTAYILAITSEAGWEIPEESRERMLRGLSAVVQGKSEWRPSFELADRTLRKLAAIEALSRYDATDPSLKEALSTIAIEPNVWPTSSVIDWHNIQRRLGLPLVQTEQVLRSRLNAQGTVLSLSNAASDNLWWLMTSQDTSAVKLLLSTLEDPHWQNDIPRLARGALLRQKHGAWDLTTANAWGVLAMRKFARLYEKNPVTGVTRAHLGNHAPELDWKSHPQGGELQMPWPPKATSLELRHAGGGAPWAMVRSRAAIPPRQPFSSGYRVTKTLTPIEQAKRGEWHVGDVAHVKLEIDAQSDLSWMVVNDPVPASATILGSGLGNASHLAGRTSPLDATQAWPAFIERSFEAFRSYYEFAPKGKIIVEYDLRFNQAGRFQLPATRVEALYAPEMLGEAPNAPITVKE